MNGKNECQRYLFFFIQTVRKFSLQTDFLQVAWGSVTMAVDTARCAHTFQAKLERELCLPRYIV